MSTQHTLITPRSLLIGFFIVFLVAAIPMLIAAPACAQMIMPGGASGTPCASNDTTCNVCMDNNTQFSAPNTGAQMISQIFGTINGILQNMESTFYNGIIGNSGFQTALGTAFVLYLAMFGIMITFNLASYRSGEISSRLIKVGFVYAMTTPGGWTLFSNLIQNPIIGGINQLIGNMANIGTGSGSCISQGAFSGSYITSSGTDASSVSVQLDSGAMSMLYGPMTCVFAAKFIAGIEALLMAGPNNWLLAALLAWGVKEFIQMLLGAIATYVKAIVGLTFLFGLAPLFIAFYLFDRSRYITLGWINMVFGFALQPVMVFAFLAFYSTIIGTALGNMFVNASGVQENLCYVPWFSMPGLVTIYWWRFTNSSGVAGGEISLDSIISSGTGAGSIANPPVSVLNALYFLVLCSLGKSFASYIGQLSTSIAGGGGAGAVGSKDIGTWFSKTFTGGKSIPQMASDGMSGVTRTVGSAWNKVSGGSGAVGYLPPVTKRPPI